MPQNFKKLLIFISLIFFSTPLFSQQKYSDLTKQWGEELGEEIIEIFEEDISETLIHLLFLYKVNTSSVLNNSNINMLDYLISFLSKEDQKKIKNLSKGEQASILLFLLVSDPIDRITLYSQAHAITYQEAMYNMQFIKNKRDKERFLKDGYAKE